MTIRIYKGIYVPAQNFSSNVMNEVCFANIYGSQRFSRFLTKHQSPSG